MKSTASAASPGFFDPRPDVPGVPLVAVPGSHRRALIISGLLALPFAIVAAGAMGWLSSSVKPVEGPLGGTWDCAIAGEPAGTMLVEGGTYSFGSNAGGDRVVGTLEIVVHSGKYREELIRVHSGTLSETFGVKLGYHAKTMDTLVFNIGPGSGIRCTRV